ncbi:RDD family protein [Hymenobacter sp. B81]|uniref:RDD family protein n=1 Tax=Hymenobacter sp. B81 TaxID=3344878 RepID=UPI0037DC756F
MALLRIPTTQNVTLEYEVASVGERIAATLIDVLVQVGWLFFWILLFGGISAFSQGLDSGVGAVLLFVLMLLPIFVYHLLCEWLLQGQSVGKRLMKVRVVSLNGLPPRFTQLLLRWVLRLIDVSTFYGLVAIVSILAGGRGQRVGDLAAGTAVVRTARRTEEADTRLFGTDHDPHYQVTFPEAANLTDHDARLVQELVTQAEQRDAYHILADVAERVRTLTGIRSSMPDHGFLITVLRDYAYLAQQGATE